MAPIRIGISACLLGQSVRWDAGHKRDDFLIDALAGRVEWVPVCPEVEVGMGTPREPVRLVETGGTLRMLGLHTGEDWTERMARFASARLAELGDLCGFVFKKGSPSCGVYQEDAGLFAAAFRAAFPDVPVEEEGRLRDPIVWESFLARVLERHQRPDR